MFATTEDVATRLGRELTDAERYQVSGALTAVGGFICSAADRQPDWEPDPTPAYFKELSIQKAIAALVNPANLASQSEQLGAFQHSETFQRSQDGGLTLSDDEGRAVRDAAYGTGAGSARTRAVVDDVFDYADDGELNDSVTS